MAWERSSTPTSEALRSRPRKSKCSTSSLAPDTVFVQLKGARLCDRLARTEGIVLDEVYTAKAMAALISWIEHDRFKANDTVLFWHTGGQMAMFYAE